MSVRRVPVFIAGQFHESSAEYWEDVPNPATGETIARVPYSPPDEVAEAVSAASAALGEWANTPVTKRVQVMFRFKNLLEQHIDELTALVVEENGKTGEEARGDMRRAIESTEFACASPTLIMGQNVAQVAPGIDQELYRFPVGVVAGITPFNFPSMIPLWMVPIALVCGNTFVLKPSQRTPLCSIRLAELLAEAGLPPGVLNIVHGAKDAVDAILGHPDVAAVSLVGSAAVAKDVYARAAANGKRVQALGGAKNHVLVMDDADLGVCGPAIISSAFGNAGQRCLAGSVAVGVGAMGEILAEDLAERASCLKIGPGCDETTEMGPVIRNERRVALGSAIDEAQRAGAKLVIDGRGAGPKEGFFMGPTIFDQVTPTMDIWRQELFGPVLSVMRCRDLDEALLVTNSSPFGNMASIFTTSGKSAREFRQRVEAGMVGVNIGVAAPMAFFPFTGWKDSFFGDLHAAGMDAVRFYCRQKIVTTRWL